MAGAALASMYVELEAVWKRGSEPTEQIQKSAQRARSALTNLFAAGVVVDQFRRAGQAASDLEGAVRSTSTVFKESQVIIDRAASGAARSVGLSERAFREATSVIGAQLKGLGFSAEEAATKSIELTEVGAALAATFGGTTTDAVGALSAAFRGEYDTAERYGLALTANKVAAEAVALGLAESATAVDDNARAVATMSLIQKGAADSMVAFGDGTRTAAQRANEASAAWEDAQASLGQALLPIMASAANLVGELAEGFSGLPQPVQTAVLALGGIAVVVGPIRNVITAIGGLGTAIGSLGAASGPIAGVAILAGTLAAAWYVLGERQRQVDAITRSVNEAMDGAAESIWATAEAAAGASGDIDGFAIAIDQLNAGLVETYGEDAVRALGQLGIQVKDLFTVVQRFRSDASLEGIANGFTAMFTEAGIASDRAAELGEMLAQSGRYAETAAGFYDKATGATIELTDAELEHVAAAKEIERLAQSTDLDAIAQQRLDVAIAIEAGAEALIRQARAHVEERDGVVTALSVWLEYQRLLGELPADQRAAADGIASTVGELEVLGGTLETVAGWFTGSANVSRDAAGGFKEWADSAAKAGDKMAGLGEKADDVITKGSGGNTAFAWLDTLEGNLDEAATAAGDLAESMSKLLGGTLSQQEAVDNLNAELDNLTAAFEENGTTLDATTEAGRANREQIRANIEAIVDYGAAMVEGGASTEEAGAAMGLLREQLINQLTPFFETREAAEAYINELGLTPDNISTAVELANVKESQRASETYRGKLDEIPPTKSTTIDVATDKASSKLTKLKQQLDGIQSKTVSVSANVSRGGVIRSAAGRVVRGGTNMLSTLGEIPGRAGDEVVLPLGNLPRMRDLLGEPGVGERVGDALGITSTAAAAPNVDVTVMIDGRVVDAAVQRRLKARDDRVRAGSRY